jgi:hypothetical protein
MSKQQVLEQALSLSLKERAELAEELIASLDEPSLEEYEGQLLEMVGLRAAEVQNGTAKLIDGEEARQRVRERLLRKV